MAISPGPVPDDWLCFGSSGTCVQIARDVVHQTAGAVRLVGYVDDLHHGHLHPDEDQPVIGFDDLTRDHSGAGVFVAISAPAGREAVYRRLDRAGISIVGVTGSAHLAHPRAQYGAGVIVASDTRVGPGSVLGRGVLAIGNLVAHDVEIGDFSTCAPASVIGGHVQVGRKVWIGLGAVVSNGTSRRPIRIGDGAVIGAGAVVDRDVPSGQTVVGTRTMTVREWLRLRRLARSEER